MTKRQRTIVGIVVAVAALLIVAAFIVPALIDLDRYRPQVIAAIETRTGKPVRIARLSLRLLPIVSVRADNFVLGNPVHFPAGDLISMRRIQANVDVTALWHHRVVIKSVKLEQPNVRLLSDSHGKWNYETSATASGATFPAGTGGKPYFSLGEISRISVTRGQFTVASVLPSGEASPNSVEVRGFSSRLSDVVPDALASSVAGSRSQNGAASTYSAQQPSVPASTRSTTERGAPAAPAPIGSGTLSADSLRVGKLDITRVKSNLQLLPGQVLLKDIGFDCYKGRGSGTISVSFTSPEVVYVAKIKVAGVDTAALLGAFLDARGRMSGKMEAQLSLRGQSAPSSDRLASDPLAGKTGTGEVVIRDGRLPTLQLKKNLLMLASFLKLGPTSGDPSAFSELSTDINIADSRITSHRMELRGNGVNVDASGNLALAGEGSVDYNGVATIAVAQSPISNILTGLYGISFSDGKLSLPFTLLGSFNHPRFGLKSPAGAQGVPLGGREAQQPLQNPDEVIRGLGELFKKRSPR
jgi:uncharacterized protein involved in outer membrane biogenesis